MSEIALLQGATITYEAKVLRGVPCKRHSESLVSCPDCLSGEEAARRGIDHDVLDLGVIARTEVEHGQNLTQALVSIRDRVHKALKKA